MANNLEDVELQDFYKKLCISEQRHHEVFLFYAKKHFKTPEVDERLDFFLEKEKLFINEIPKRAALH